MVDVLNHSVPAAARAPEKSYDITILVSVGLLAAALIIVILASVFPVEVNPGDLDLMGPPYP
ncbi:MAG TPA: hypothetical protein VGH39_05765 [Xanthobacteraceae bacterium]|jgi:hypothetical protein